MADKDPAQQAALKALETAGPQGKVASFLVQNWKQIIIAWLLWVLLVIGLSLISIYFICTCTVGVMEAGLLRTLGIFGLSGGNQQTVGTSSGGTQGGVIGKDCAKNLIKQANGSLSDSEAQLYIDKVNEAAAKFGTDPALMLAQLEQESHFKPNAQSDIYENGVIVDHAQGIAQFIPSTWSGVASKYNIDGNGNGTENVWEAEDGIYAQAAYNVDLKKTLGSLGSIENIVAAYNAGPGAVQRFGGIPPYSETRDYVKIIMDSYQRYKKCLQQSNISSPSISGMYYPLGKGYPLEDPHTGARFFGADRGDRYHAGVDLISQNGAKVYSISNGKIVNYYKFTDPSMGLNTTYCIFVDHGDYVINYGEVSGMAPGLQIGSQVAAGQYIGNVGQVSSNAMLHLEMYTSGTKKNQPWYKNSDRPANLLDPTSLIDSLTNNKVE